jgi:ABC-type multidrug transport system fused ATPase/permease subunit
MVEDAARRAHADAFIRTLPHGYATVVSEQGASLSGGQRQRLAIARAVLRDPAILIMDEATSQVDAESEEQINAAIAEFGRGRTVIVVAHRLSTVRNADRIAVLDGGKLVGFGPHEELLGTCETYRRLVKTQLVGG